MSAVAFTRHTYQVAPELSPGTEDSFLPTPSFRTSEPGESSRDELLLSKLGIRGWGRLHYFRNSFSGPWGEGHERPFSPRAMEAFFSFLEQAELPAHTRPSLFLTDEGHLELIWRDESGRSVQLEFGPQETEFYLEAAGVEKTVPNADLPSLAARHFSAPHAH